ncbi:MAG: glutathione S-transferase N-terminal domain-containing protein, partial [Sphingomicrobium sp.]
MTLTLYVHPFSSFSWKALIPLWADETPFTYRNVDPSEPGVMDELKAHWPLGKFPTLVDDGKVIPEATCIIEHLQAYHHGPTKWIPDGADGRRVRFLDRFF